MLKIFAKKIDNQEILDYFKSHFTKPKIVEEVKNYPNPILPKNLDDYSFSILDIDPLEIARQLTLTTYEIFDHLKINDLIHEKISTTDTHSLNVKKLVQRFNQLSLYFVHLILSEKSLKKRKEIMIYVIQLKRYLFEMNNFNDTISISASLQNACVYRLLQTKNKIQNNIVESDKVDEKIDIRNPSGFLFEIQQTNEPYIPYLGFYLSSFFAINEQHEDLNGKINWTKRKLFYENVQDLFLFKKKRFSLKKNFEIERIIEEEIDKIYKSDNEYYKISLNLEPRISMSCQIDYDFEPLDFSLKKSSIFQNPFQGIKKISIGIVGPSNVGKTSIISRFVHNTIKREYSNNLVKENKKLNINGITIDLTIFDYSLKKKEELQISKFDIIFFVFSLNDSTSFDKLKNEFISKFTEFKNVVLIGNKCDLEQKIEFKDILISDKITITNILDECFESKSIDFYECSARRKINIDKLFYNSVAKFLKKKK